MEGTTFASEAVFLIQNRERFTILYKDANERYNNVFLKSKMSVEALLYYAYTEINAIMNGIKKNNTLTCAKGCSSCCYGDIFLSPLEGLLVTACIEQLEVTIDKELVARQKATPYKNRKYVDKRCALLNKEGACSIYEGRPIICRVWNSVSDPIKCDLSTGIQTAETIRSLEVYVIAGLLGKMSEELLGKSNINLITLL